MIHLRALSTTGAQRGSIDIRTIPKHATWQRMGAQIGAGLTVERGHVTTSALP